MTLLFMVSLGLAGVPGPQALAAPATEWPQFLGGPAHQGVDQPSTITPANVSALELAWHADIDVYTSPAVADGVVYVGASTGLHAFPAICSREPSCEPLWTAAIPVTSESPAVVAGVVYVGTLDGLLYAFDAGGVVGCSGVPKTCAPLWTAETGDWIPASPAIAGGRVYVGSGDGKLYAFDAAGGTNCGGTPKTCGPLWTAQMGNEVHSTPAVSEGTVYVGTIDNRLYAYDAAGVTNCAGMPTTCAPLWTADTGPNGFRAPTVADGVVYVHSGTLQAYDAAGVAECAGTPRVCAPMWTTSWADGWEASPAVADGVVYVSADDNTLRAYDAAGIANCSAVTKVCAPLWTARASQQPWGSPTSPVVVNGLVFTATRDLVGNVVHAFDATGVTNCSGEPKHCSPLWSGDTGDPGRASPAVAGAYLYASTRNGLRAFGLPVSADGAFHPAGPHRVLDTREQGGALAPGETRSLTLRGRVPLPASRVSSVVLNVAVTQPTDNGWLTVFPSGTVRPLASSINFAPGQTLSNAVVAKLGANGAVDIFNVQGSTHVVVDVEGWFGVEGTEPGSRYTPLAPARVLDTRLSAALNPRATLSLPLGGFGGVPGEQAVAVVLNVAVTQPTTDGWLTLFASGTSRPLASSINFGPGQTVANKVVVPLGVGWGVDIYNDQGDTHVVVDVEGWFGFPGSAPGVPYHPLTPTRILDTRETVAVPANGTLTLPVTGVGGVPATGVSAVVLNVAVTQPTALGFLTVYPSGEAQPLASSLNFAAGQTVSNAVVAKVGAGGTVKIYNSHGDTHIVVDMQGWFGV